MIENIHGPASVRAQAMGGAGTEMDNSHAECIVSVSVSGICTGGTPWSVAYIILIELGLLEKIRLTPPMILWERAKVRTKWSKSGTLDRNLVPAIY